MKDGRATFQLEISENNVIFFPSKFSDSKLRTLESEGQGRAAETQLPQTPLPFSDSTLWGQWSIWRLGDIFLSSFSLARLSFSDLCLCLCVPLCLSVASQSIIEGTGQTQGIPVAWAQCSKESSLIPGSLGAERGGVPEPRSSGGKCGCFLPHPLSHS